MTNATQSPARGVEVTQADREAAASFYQAHLARAGEVPVACAMRVGHIDESPLVQAFAHHRLAHSTPPAQPEDGWRTIDSAPKDGSDIQLWGEEDWTPEAHWCEHKGGWYKSYWDADWQSYAESSIFGVTHWMPLPAAPKHPSQSALAIKGGGVDA